MNKQLDLPFNKNGDKQDYKNEPYYNGLGQILPWEKDLLTQKDNPKPQLDISNDKPLKL